MTIYYYTTPQGEFKYLTKHANLTDYQVKRKISTLVKHPVLSVNRVGTLVI